MVSQPEQSLEQREDGTVVAAIRVNARQQHLAANRSYIEKALQMATVAESDISKIILAVDESLANIMEHGVQSEGQRGEFFINLDLEASSSRVCIQIRDPGEPFDPAQIVNPNMKDHVAQGKRGGLGIFIIRKIMDRFEHTYEDGFNVLIMEKHF